MKEQCRDLIAAVADLQEALVDQAEAHLDWLAPGMTHLQRGQPVLLAHHLLAYAWMLDRDANEAAFITSAGDAPSVGEQLELSEPYLANASTGRQAGERIAQLPKFGRVVRLDDPQGDTRRVAIRFERQPQPTRM